MPLGEKLYEEHGTGNAVSVKAIPSGTAAIMDFTFTSKVTGYGRLKGKVGTNRATVEILAGGEGVASGVGRGVMKFGKGETVAWERVGINTVKGDHPFYVAVLRFTTTSRQLAWLDGLIGVVEGEIDSDLHNIHRTAHAWVF